MLLHTHHSFFYKFHIFFALISQQKFDDRPLFNPGAHWFSEILNNFRANSFCHKPISNNIEFTFMGKNSEKKCILL